MSHQSAALKPLPTDSPQGASHDPLYRRGVLLVLLAGTLWSTSGVAVRLIGEASAWQILFWRAVFLVPTALLLMALLGRRRGQPLQLLRALCDVGWRGLLGGLAVSCASIFYVLALQMTTVANVVFLIATAPFLTALLGLLLLREPVAHATWWTMALAFCGVLIMIDGQLTADSLPGFVLGLVCALCFALFNVSVRAGRAVEMQPLQLLNGLFLLLISSIALLWLDVPFELHGEGLMLCVYMAVLQMGLGGFLYIRGARHVPAAECSLLALIEVLLGPLWVWLVVAEVPGESTLIGGGVVLLAVAIRAALVVRRRPPLRVA